MSIKKYKFTEKNSFNIEKFRTNDKGEFSSREDAVEEFVENLKEINVLQQKLYAERKEGVIFIFQAMDAAGKDGCIRTVFSTLTPHGVKEFCFKAPSTEELSHDYLWRFWSALPARGNISIFNRSYYEDVLIGKVHKLYENQIVPDRLKNVDVIQKRYKEINDFEEYLYNNATRVVKIFLNVSKDEQARRFISRIETPKKNWKVSEGDIKEREYWNEYQEAFETMINETSSEKSPWYVVPADRKWYARLIVSRIVLKTLKEINPQFPEISEENIEKIQAYKDVLLESIDDNKLTKEEIQGILDCDCKCDKEETSAFEKTLNGSKIYLEAKGIEKEDGKCTVTIEDNIKENFDENIQYSEPLETTEEAEVCNEKQEDDKKKNKKKKHKKKDKKKKSKKEKKKKIKKLDKELDENVFFDASDVVTDTYIEEELERLEEKEIETTEKENTDETNIDNEEKAGETEKVEKKDTTNKNEEITKVDVVLES